MYDSFYVLCFYIIHQVEYMTYMKTWMNVDTPDKLFKYIC